VTEALVVILKIYFAVSPKKAIVLGSTGQWSMEHCGETGALKSLKKRR